MGLSKALVVADIFALAWGVKMVPLELTAALDLPFHLGVVLYHYLELNVVSEVVKR